MSAQMNAYNKYKQNNVVTASPGELTLMLYNGCIKFIGQGRKAIEDNNIQLRNMYIQKAQAIIAELMSTLKMDMEISKQMLPLYEYINHLLIEANIHSDISSLDEALKLVTEFRDTWKEVIKITRQQQFSNVSQV